MRRIVFNADDFGLSNGVNQGILKCYLEGVLNSATLLTNFDYFEEAVELINKYRLANIGLHFNLTEGSPLIKNHKTIVNDQGVFIRNVHELVGIDKDEVYMELEAQLQKAVNAGVMINHIDSHHHIHMTSALREVFCRLSKKYKLPLRKIENTSRNPLKIIQFYIDTFYVPYYTNNFHSDFYDDNATESNLIDIVKSFKGSSLEIMCHPGYVDKDNGIYNEERENELAVLTSKSLKGILKQNIK
ncbi:MAG: carbohydrate deacetylase [Aequorivita sp.]